MMAENKADEAVVGPRYLGGKEDILYFCENQLEIVRRRDDVWDLTVEGKRLFAAMETPSFPISLHRLLVEKSRDHFSYFALVYDALRAAVESGRDRVSRSEFNSILQQTNRFSGTEIKNLLKQCGAIEIRDTDVYLTPAYFESTPESLREIRLLRSAQGHLDLATVSTVPELISAVAGDFPDLSREEVEGILRRHLRTSRTRTMEYVDGLADVP